MLGDFPGLYIFGPDHIFDRSYSTTKPIFFMVYQWPGFGWLTIFKVFLTVFRLLDDFEEMVNLVEYKHLPVTVLSTPVTIIILQTMCKQTSKIIKAETAYGCFQLFLLYYFNWKVCIWRPNFWLLRWGPQVWVIITAELYTDYEWQNTKTFPIKHQATW